VAITVSVSPEGAGVVEIDGDAEAEYPAKVLVRSGDTVKIEAFAKEGYHFVDWSEANYGYIHANPHLESACRDLNLTANFAPNECREFVSEDGTLIISIPEGTTALDGNGNPLTEVKFIPIEEELEATEETSIIGMPYQLLPEGATFDQPVTLTWKYDSDDIPEGIHKEGLMVARCDTCDNGEVKWEEVESEINTEEDIVIAYIEHFSTFAVIGPTESQVSESIPSVTSILPASFTLSNLLISPNEVSAGETVSISLLANTGEEDGTCTINLRINGEIEEAREISLPYNSKETITFTTSQSKAGDYSIDVNGLVGSFTVKEGEPTPGAPVTRTHDETNPWFIRIVIIVISAAIAVPLIARWRRRRTDYGTLNYISPRFR